MNIDSPKSVPPTGNAGLDADSILTAEFVYISQTALQSNEDRARVANFYLVSVGSFIAALFGAQSSVFVGRDLFWAFSVLFAGLSIYGLLTVLQLVRLRLAWFESINAMNQIKSFYIQHAAMGDVAEAFLWSAPTVPPKFKVNSVSFLNAVQTSVLSGIMMGTAVVYWGLTYGLTLVQLGLGIGVGFALLLIGTYSLLLRRK
jgi:hypothetical protein